MSRQEKEFINTANIHQGWEENHCPWLTDWLSNVGYPYLPKQCRLIQWSVLFSARLLKEAWRPVKSGTRLGEPKLSTTYLGYSCYLSVQLLLLWILQACSVMKKQELVIYGDLSNQQGNPSVPKKLIWEIQVKTSPPHKMIFISQLGISASLAKMFSPGKEK